MKNERNALRAGLFIVISIGLIIAVVVGIKGLEQFLEPTMMYRAKFDLSANIGGLANGDEVRIGGAKVGVVEDVEIEPGDNPPGIVVAFSFPKRYQLNKDAVLRIESSVTGVSVLNFESLGTGSPIADGDVIAGNGSALNALLGAGTDVAAVIRDVRNVTLPKVNDTVTTFKGTGESATDLIKHVRTKIDPIVERYYGVADKGKEALAQVSSLFGDTKTDFRTTIANLANATTSVKDKLPGILDKTDGSLTKVQSALDQINEAMTDVKDVAVNLKDVSASARSILVTNRSRIDQMVISLKATGDNLKNATAEIRRSPWRLLYKPGPGEIENLNLYDSARQFAEGASAMQESVTALRDLLKDQDADAKQVQLMIEKLDKSFQNFTTVEAELWKQVRE